MKRCPAGDCGSPVPIAARFCPRCGCRLRHPGGWMVLALLLGLGMVFVFLLAASDRSVVMPPDPENALRTPKILPLTPMPTRPLFPAQR